MSDQSKINPEEPFDLQYQNAIFNFLFLLVDYYKMTMTSQEAINKACDWLTSLANHIKSKSLEITTEINDKTKLFTKLNNGQDI